MGIEINQTKFSKHEFAKYQETLIDQLEQLKMLLHKQGSFGKTPKSIGAELELNIINNKGLPLNASEEILKKAHNPKITHELNTFNLEYNVPFCLVKNKPFETLEQRIVEQLNLLNQLAKPLGGQVVPIGILPTLKQSHLGAHSMTQRKRYTALKNQLKKQRSDKFKIQIDGRHPIDIEMRDITLEGANTSFQVHVTVAPDEFAQTYNAYQLITPLVVAIGANSPLLFGHSLWQETRIPLFKQSIDTRQETPYKWTQPARVSYGEGWLRNSAYELFSGAVQLYPPLLPVFSKSPQNTTPPELAELKLHLGTVWWWNRPVYDHRGKGHLRIELRSLPAGPTAVDMMANAAFMIGLAEGYKPIIDECINAIPFSTAEYNFYRCAKLGMQAEIIWPKKNLGFQHVSVTEIVTQSLPIADEGLQRLGIGEKERKHYLGIIEQRINKQTNGATWQQQSLEKLNYSLGDTKALQQMFKTYITNCNTNKPVTEWEIGHFE